MTLETEGLLGGDPDGNSAAIHSGLVGWNLASEVLKFKFGSSSVQVLGLLCSHMLSIIWLLAYLCLFIFVSRFVSMAYFALPPQSVPIRIVNPAAAAAASATSAATATAARVASPDAHSPHPATAAGPHPDRPDRLDRPDRPVTPKAVIGSVLPISPSLRHAQSYYRLVPTIMS